MRLVKGLRWYIITLIALATVINYIDRNALAVMWPSISKDVGLTKDDYAAIVSFFMVAYALGQSLSGRLIDKVGTRLGFVITIFAWSISCMLHGLGRSLMTFGFFRAMLGLSEAGNWPGATKANAEWFPIKERAFAQGIFNAGASIGAVISAPLVAFLYLLVGWKATFVLIGILGLIWIIPWWFINRAAPDGHPWLTPEEKEYILSGQKVASTTPVDERVLSWGELLSYKESWSVILSRFFLDPVWWLFVNWLPIYLAEVFGFDIKQIGIFAWVPYVGAAAGSLLGGWYSGHLMKRGWAVGKARKWAILLGGIISFPALIATAYAADPVAAVLLIAVILFGFQVSINNIQTLPSDLFSGKSVGSLAGLGGTSAVVGVLISTWTVPAISQQGYLLVFLLAAALVPLAVGSVYLLAGKVERVALKQ
ncbi:MAG: MFS transporter [Bacteroidetes bacterium]|jgi:ACS family hexuronate transporter-like MFS transporter|nr:MFS transporter [Bacteroidota bacterium]